MSRSSSAALNDAPANDWASEAPTASMNLPTWAEDKSPTRRLPVFRLEEEARRLDEAAEAATEEAAALAATRCDEDATVTVSAEDNVKLLASIFPNAAYEKMPSPVGEAPSPSSPEALTALPEPRPRPARVTARPPALKMLVITRPPPPPHTPSASLPPLPSPPPPAAPVAKPPQSGFHARVTPELVEAARELRDAKDPRPSAATRKSGLPKADTTTRYVVAGIWAMALSLIAFLVFVVTSA